MLEICWKSVQTLISLPVRGYRPHPNRDEFGCETLDERIREFITSPLTVRVTCETSQSGRIVLYYSFVCETSVIAVGHFVCETSQFDHFRL